jgi:hypothetical protein
MGGEGLNQEAFLKLPAREVCRMVDRNERPHTGIFIADGNRRLVMTHTGLTPEDDGFYSAYPDLVTESFKHNLEVFFQHGLHTLLFPLFGPSLLTRTEAYRCKVMPELVRQLFKSRQWLSFYREQAIRIKAYGNLEILSREFPGLNLAEAIRECEQITAAHRKHRLFYGFFSTQVYDLAFIRQMQQFSQTQQRAPDRSELARLYYREPLRSADFFITSTRMGYLGALPPFAYGKNTRMYTLAAPGVFGLNETTYRKILYDLLLPEPGDPSSIKDTTPAGIDFLGEYYQRNRSRILGTGKQIGKWQVMDDFQ